MSSRVQIACLLFLYASCACATESSTRFVQKLALPFNQTAVVAEGDFEARSTGSYSVRIYATERAQPVTTPRFSLPESSGLETARLKRSFSPAWPGTKRSTSWSKSAPPARAATFQRTPSSSRRTGSRFVLLSPGFRRMQTPSSPLAPPCGGRSHVDEPT